MIKGKWMALNPNQQKNLVFAGIVSIVVTSAIFGYYASRADVEVKKPIEKTRTVSLDKNLLERSANSKLRNENALLNERIVILEGGVVEDEEAEAEEEEEFIQPRPTPKPRAYAVDYRVDLRKPPIPASPPVVVPDFMRLPPVPSYQPVPTVPVKEEPRWRGGITVVSNPEKITPKEVAEAKKERSIYLPSGSFMEAMLLSGLDAKTIESGKSDPVPVLLRVTNLAVLPNDLKSHLKGCFIIASGFGDLADERVALRLNTLSCITKQGQAVIDQPVRGMVVDSDGKVGLRGTVVSKMGSVLARSFLAGFFGGIGNGLQAASKTTTVGAAVGLTNVQTDDLAQAGVGAGLSQSSGELQRFYLDLAKATMPVIEVGATKNVTVVISEGVELKISNHCVGGAKC